MTTHPYATAADICPPIEEETTFFAAGEEEVSVKKDLEGYHLQVVYLVVDASSSMTNDVAKLTKCVQDFINQAANHPVVNDRAQVCIISFDSKAQVLTPMSELAGIEPPIFVASGGTNYGAALHLLKKCISEDVARLKARGAEVFRPFVILFTDGEPGDSDYAKTFKELFAYDVETEIGFKYYPYMCAYGFRDAKADVLSKVTYPDFGSRKGEYFLVHSDSIADLLDGLANNLFQSLLLSGNQAAEAEATGNVAGVEQPVPPKVPGAQAGTAGDHSGGFM